jgi:membrane associated rhomboid family serine protease
MVDTRMTCYRHPDRVTGASCTRCGRPICPDCMVQAAVGHHCPTCVRDGQSVVRQPRWRPTGSGRVTPVVSVLIALNVVAFLLTGGGTSIQRFSEWGNRVAAGQYYRLITAAFLHASVLHIVFNMAALLIFGPAVEAAIGRVRFASMYLLAALGGSVCSYLFGSPFVQAVGASGAIFGVLGAYFAIARARRAETSGIAILIVINLVISFADPVIDWRAHVGGLVTGLVLGGVFAFAERRPLATRVFVEVLSCAAVLVLAIGLVHLRTDQLRVLPA